MKKILIYVQPEAEERDRVVAWAADLVEALTAPIIDAGASPAVEIGVVADVLNCLEIGLVTLGRGAARTVEGGERDASPVSLFPFRPPDADESATDLDTAYDCLRELADGGAVEGISHSAAEDSLLPDAHAALGRALARGGWETVVTLGDSEVSRLAIQFWSKRGFRPRIVQPEPDEEFRERVATLLQRLEPESEDTYKQVRRFAVYNAIQLATMLEQLGLEE